MAQGVWSGSLFDLGLACIAFSVCFMLMILWHQPGSHGDGCSAGAITVDACSPSEFTDVDSLHKCTGGNSSSSSTCGANSDESGFSPASMINFTIDLRACLTRATRINASPISLFCSRWISITMGPKGGQWSAMFSSLRSVLSLEWVVIGAPLIFALSSGALRIAAREATGHTFGTFSWVWTQFLWHTFSCLNIGIAFVWAWYASLNVCAGLRAIDCSIGC